MELEKDFAGISQDLAELGRDITLLQKRAEDIIQKAQDTGIWGDVNALAVDPQEPTPQEHAAQVGNTNFTRKAFMDSFYGSEQFVAFMNGTTLDLNTPQNAHRIKFNIAAMLEL